ncbi:hypothetical protein DQ393_16590 [Rhizobium tropici]|uniref:Uncharacterized protein n=1 Tax=Rhizobium tropici TaxID=398 RepID=A0A329Y7U8_RHITR|nr:hypothetical protein DQ393_16590 [Rhizobium tropici]
MEISSGEERRQVVLPALSVCRIQSFNDIVAAEKEVFDNDSIIHVVVVGITSERKEPEFIAEL